MFYKKIKPLHCTNISILFLEDSAGVLKMVQTLFEFRACHLSIFCFSIFSNITAEVYIYNWKNAETKYRQITSIHFKQSLDQFLALLSLVYSLTTQNRISYDLLLPIGSSSD